MENYEGDLDEHFIKDYGLSLSNRLTYSKEDERNNTSTIHNIPINGNLRTGSATLKQAVKLYMTFKDSNFKPIENSNNSFKINKKTKETEQKKMKTSKLKQIWKIIFQS